MSSRFVRFLAAGVGATAVHAAVVLVLVQVANWSYAAANLVAALVATVFSWAVNTLWTFGQKVGAGNAARFMTVAGFGALMAAFIGGVAQRAGLGPVMGVVLVVAVVTPMTYLLHRHWTFARR